ncbi:zinc finger protein SNAI2-like [Culicoides brevitarsis]|uniref:zinc finger protein SNAI2-like n=1 Tax=Culicoides brevitarsis TaxID=469753 RepID=UPI00307B10CE
MPTSIMQKNYSHCPLKKRPVNIVREENIKQESDSEMEPENLSTKPEDLSKTGKYANTKILTPPHSEESSSSPPPAEIKKSPIRIPTPTYPTNIPSYYARALSKQIEEAPLNLSPAASPRIASEQQLSLANPINWHKPLSPPIQPNYLSLPIPGYPHHLLPNYPHAASEQYLAAAYHHAQLSPSRSPSQLSPYSMHRESSVSPPYSSMSPPLRNNVIKHEYNNSRYMPYHIPHHAYQSSLSPTSSHASFNSFRSMSPISNTSNTTVSEDLSSVPALSVLMEKSTSNSNIQKSHSNIKKDHEKTSGAPRYSCPDCKKSYSTYSGLSKHQQFHCAAATGKEAKTFSCKFCQKQYASLGALKMHIRTHTLPCKCNLCGKAFSRPWLLQGHIRTHTGEKPFSCQHCNRAFADRSNLRAHLQTHSDVKKYSCQSCSKTFSRMSLLTKHSEGGCPGQNNNNNQSGQQSFKQEMTMY